MTEYEVLGLDQCDPKGSLSMSVSPSDSESAPVTASATPQSSPPSTPSPPPSPLAPEPPEEVGTGVQTSSSSPQLRLIKRKAPEVDHLVTAAAQLLPDANRPRGVAIYSPRR